MSQVERFAVACILMACGSPSVVRPRPAEVAVTPFRPPGAAASPERGDGLPTLRELLLRAPEVAPEMRALLQGEAAPPANAALPKADVDLCVRAVFAAGQPVRAKFVTEEEGTLAEVGPVNAGVLGLHGPVCVRRGRMVTLTFDEGAPLVRYVVWGAP